MATNPHHHCTMTVGPPALKKPRAEPIENDRFCAGLTWSAPLTPLRTRGMILEMCLPTALELEDRPA